MMAYLSTTYAKLPNLHCHLFNDFLRQNHLITKALAASYPRPAITEYFHTACHSLLLRLLDICQVCTQEVFCFQSSMCHCYIVSFTSISCMYGSFEFDIPIVLIQLQSHQ